jgi:DNA topoisomerase-1
MHLVIVESPTKAKALRGFLGREYRVLASMGHVRDLPLKQLGVDVDHNFQPTYHLRKRAGKVLKRLRETVDAASDIYLATDPDREGEAIAWHVLQAAKIRGKPVHRVTFHEITPQAIKAALASPGSLDMDLVNAQKARRVLDRLVGYQVSPVLWKAIKGRKGLSAGRVQTVALRLVVERDREIESFVPVEYWTLDAEFSKVNDDRRFRARPTPRPSSKRWREPTIGCSRSRNSANPANPTHPTPPAPFSRTQPTVCIGAQTGR